MGAPFPLLDIVADAYFKYGGKVMGQMNEQLTKKTAAEGSKVASDYNKAFDAETRKSKAYADWMAGAGDDSQTRKSTTEKLHAEHEKKRIPFR